MVVSFHLCPTRASHPAPVDENCAAPLVEHCAQSMAGGGPSRCLSWSGLMNPCFVKKFRRFLDISGPHTRSIPVFFQWEISR